MTEAAVADHSADRRFADALLFNQRGDNYTILTVIFALVLFFAAVSSRLGSRRTTRISEPGSAGEPGDSLRSAAEPYQRRRGRSR